jgi:uncharacterized membrane protein
MRMANNLGRRSRARRFLDGIHLLISHHQPPFMNRCWHLTVRGHTLHVCARCSALLLGVILAMTLQFRFLYIPVTPIAFFGAFLLSLPAVVDWSTQTLELRESRNRVRATTGGLLGFAVGYVLTSGNLLYYLLVVILYSGYTLSFGAVASRIVARRRRD